MGDTISLQASSESALDISSFSTSFLLKFTFLINPNFNVKLDDTGHLVWKEQLHHVIIVYGLQSFIDGMTIAPSRLIKKSLKIVNKETGEQVWRSELKIWLGISQSKAEIKSLQDQQQNL